MKEPRLTSREEEGLRACVRLSVLGAETPDLRPEAMPPAPPLACTLPARYGDVHVQSTRNPSLGHISPGGTAGGGGTSGSGRITSRCVLPSRWALADLLPERRNLEGDRPAGPPAAGQETKTAQGTRQGTHRGHRLLLSPARPGAWKGPLRPGPSVPKQITRNTSPVVICPGNGHVLTSRPGWPLPLSYAPTI